MKRLFLFAILAMPLPLLAQDAMFRGNPEHTGVYGGAGTPKFTKVRWQFQTKGQVLSSPTIAGNILYIGSGDHLLYALNLSSGVKKWSFKTDSRITSSPAVSEGVVYFGSYDGNFYAVGATSGELKWKFKPEASVASVQHIFMVPNLLPKRCRTRLILFSLLPLFGTETSILAAAIPTSTRWMPRPEA